MRTILYVDGFNLYYGCLKGTPHKWLDLGRLAVELFPAPNTITAIKYFTARVSGATDPDAPRRQATYLKALRTIAPVEIYFGNFLPKPLWRPLLNLPVAGRNIMCAKPVAIEAGTHVVDGGRPQVIPVGSYPAPGANRAKGKRKAPKPQPHAQAMVVEVHSMEEKGSDVNLAVHLLNDAWLDKFDVAAVLSNDTDLITPVEMVTQERGKQVCLVSTHRHWPAPPTLAAVSTSVLHIRSNMLATSQFNSPLQTPDGPIEKPLTW